MDEKSSCPSKFSCEMNDSPHFQSKIVDGILVGLCVPTKTPTELCYNNRL